MTYYLDLFGCAKNQVDAENMSASLNRAGWTAAENPEDADIIIINSCGFIESAKRESINAVLSWRKLCPEKKILLAGCLAQRYTKELSTALPEADGFFGNSDLSGIVEAAALVCQRGTPVFNLGGGYGFGRAVGPKKTASGLRLRPDTGCVNSGERPLFSLPGSAYVKISEGCDNRCSFCAIPFIRGALKSRRVSDIMEECKTLLERGIKELCLIGQDLGSYGLDWPDDSTAADDSAAELKGSGLPDLLEALSRLKGNFWIRLLYIHPDHFPLDILGIIGRDKRFLPYFDIPFQHGSEKILKAMNRRLNAGAYLDLIETIRRRLPDAVIRSTLMTGFPGETEEDFALLLDFQQKARLDWLGCFTYSREENTAAWSMKGRVAKKTAAERKRLLEKKQVPITEKQMDRFIGRAIDVLVEEKFEPIAGSGSDEGELYLGRLPFQAPEVDSAAVILSPQPLELGAMVPCRVIARRGFDMEVKL